MADKVVRGKTRRILTPRMKCMWARLNDPMPPFEGEDKPAYWQIHLRYEADNPDHVAFKKAVDQWAAQEKEKLAAQWGKRVKADFPWIKEQDVKEDGEVVETFLSVHATSNATYRKGDTEHAARPVTLVDSVNRPFDRETLIGNGSIVRAEIGFRPVISNFGFSLKRYLNAVQVVELVSYEAESPFDAVDGGYVAEEIDDSPFVGADYLNKGQEEIPF